MKVWLVMIARVIDSYWYVWDLQEVFSTKEKAEQWVSDNGQAVLEDCKASEEPELEIIEWEVQ